MSSGRPASGTGRSTPWKQFENAKATAVLPSLGRVQTPVGISGGARGSGGGGQGWKALLDMAADMDLWGGVRRHERGEPWKTLLEEATLTLLRPRQPLPPDVVKTVLQGCDTLTGDKKKIEDECSRYTRNNVVVFVSSTFTDIKAERNSLMRDVYPYLRQLCRRLGLDFGSVDMRWGVSEETTREHGTTEMCVKEVNRCTSTSAGPAFLCLLGDKYGYRSFPTDIDAVEFTSLMMSLRDAGEDTSLFDSYFELDRNALPPVYTLKAQTAEMKTWDVDYERMQRLLRTAASKSLTQEEAEKYFVSVTETEMQSGIFANATRASQVTLVERSLSDVTAPVHLHRHLVDMSGNQVDVDAQTLLGTLKDVKVMASLPPEDVVKVAYELSDRSSVEEYVRRVCDVICERLGRSILDNYARYLHTEKDELFTEVLQHRAVALDKSKTFVGRDDLLLSLARYTSPPSSSTGSRLYAVYGSSGCGKTALMAMAAKASGASLAGGGVNPCVVLRFLGTTVQSSSARALLHSVCLQITRVYERDITAVPDSYKDLIVYFRACLEFATSSHPLTLILDSLDQLSNEDFAWNLKWLPLKAVLPQHVRLVVSTLEGPCLDALRAFLPPENLLQVKPLDLNEGPDILDRMMQTAGRTLTDSQRRVVLQGFKSCPLPLYLRLAADIAIRWKSFTEVSVIPADMPSLITLLLSRLDARYGSKFVQRALGYISAAKNGLSTNELEDILSCDDIVLDEIYAWWVPPFRRIPPLLWIRVRNELGGYLVERGTDGVGAYAWYHRQFWETAAKLYLKDRLFEREARSAIADYFDGRWVVGKPCSPKKSSPAANGAEGQTLEDRHVAVQPIVLAGTRDGGRTLNRRKLRELSQQLLKLEDWKRFGGVVARLEFIEAKFEAGQGNECLSEFLEASSLAGAQLGGSVSENDVTKLKAYSKFIGANLSHLIRQPCSIYQLASQQVLTNPVRVELNDFLASLASNLGGGAGGGLGATASSGAPGSESSAGLSPLQGLPKLVFARDLSPSSVEDPCEMTLLGHTSGVRCCCYSPDGAMIASAAEDGTLRLWESRSGAEIITVTDLPGPTYPSLADPYHGERPCCFSPDGRRVATGSEDGFLQVWDLSGAQVHSAQVSKEGVTGVVFSHNGQTLAACSKDRSVRVYSVREGAGDKYPLLGVVEGLEGQALGVDYSPDDGLLCACLGGGSSGLVIINAKTHSIVSSKQGYIQLNICCGFSPRGHQIATGGSDSSITLWNVASGNPENKLTGHKGWIWCVRYNRDGSKLFSCSSDRSFKIWEPDTQSCIATVGGHLHRVCWVSIIPPAPSSSASSVGEGGRNSSPPEDRFVTGSLDMSLKVWNMDAVVAGRVPSIGGLHYIFLRISPDGRYVVSNQGWGSSCLVCEVVGTEVRPMGSAASHGGFVDQGAFTADSTKFVSIDTGHGGQYSTGAVLKAHALVSSIPPGDSGPVTLAALAPCAVACGRNVIIIGTADDKARIHSFDVKTYQLSRSWSFMDGGSDLAKNAEGELRVMGVACSPNSDEVAVAAGSVVKIWNIGKSPVTFIRELPDLGAPAKFVAFSPDGRHLAASSIAGLVRIHDVTAAYVRLRDLVGHVTALKHLAYSPGGRYLATVAVEMCLRVWDVEGGYTLRSVWFGPTNSFGFVSDTRIVLGEATGNRKFVDFA